MTLRARVKQGILGVKSKGSTSCFELQDWLDSFLAADTEAAMLPQPEFMQMLEEVMLEQNMVLDQSLVHYKLPEYIAKMKA